MNQTMIICPTCKSEFQATKQRKKFCSQQCYTASDEFNARIRQMQAENVARHKEKYPQGKLPPHVGVCQHCEQEFRSAYKGKKYCSMKCYSSSPACLDRCRAQSKKRAMDARKASGFDSTERLTKKCLQCESEIYVKPKEFDKKKYCSHRCYRAYMADRFDRWVANPETIALPQCYDEFLTQEELPCLIDGCGWAGKNLGNHVNFTHGITAAEFKEMAGFNHSTGLVTPDVAAKLGEGKAELMKRIRVAPPDNAALLSAPRHPLRFEGKEHGMKAQAIIRTEYQQNPDEIVCIVCQTRAVKVAYGARRLYCSIECRSKYYASRRWEMECCQCGASFLGDQYQWRRARKGLDVCCSLDCRNARNIVLTPNYQKHLARLEEEARTNKVTE